MVFRFRLQRMLGFISLREKSKKLEVAALLRAIRSAEARHAYLQSVIESLLKESKTRMQESLAWVTYENAKVVSTVQELGGLERELVKSRDELALKQEALNRLVMRRRALESLKQAKHSEWKLVANRNEQKKIDDIFVMNRGKRNE